MTSIIEHMQASTEMKKAIMRVAPSKRLKAMIAAEKIYAQALEHSLAWGDDSSTAHGIASAAAVDLIVREFAS